MTGWDPKIDTSRDWDFLHTLKIYNFQCKGLWFIIFSVMSIFPVTLCTFEIYCFQESNSSLWWTLSSVTFCTCEIKDPSCYLMVSLFTVTLCTCWICNFQKSDIKSSFLPLREIPLIHQVTVMSNLTSNFFLDRICKINQLQGYGINIPLSIYQWIQYQTMVKRI